jgi:hypothetical protein
VPAANREPEAGARILSQSFQCHELLHTRLCFGFGVAFRQHLLFVLCVFRDFFAETIAVVSVEVDTVSPRGSDVHEWLSSY